MSDAVIEFDSVCGGSGAEHSFRLRNASFALKAGHITAVRAGAELEYRGVLDLALGLEEPLSGRVLYKGRDWRMMNAFEEAACRGETGAVFEAPGWISSLSVIRNVTLRVRHHTKRPDDDILREVDELAGIAGVRNSIDLALRPHVIQSRRLRCYEWIRACMGHPSAVIMAFPERGASSSAIDGLVRLLTHTAEHGSAVMLISDTQELPEQLAALGADLIDDTQLFCRKADNTSGDCHG